MMTGLKIVTSALRRAGVITSLESPTADEANDTLEAINDMLESWANDSLMVFQRTHEDFALTGAAQYSVGVGQDFNTTPFMQIISAYVRQGTIDYPIKEISDEDFADITIKNTTGIPAVLNHSGGFPIGTVRLYPVPSSAYRLFVVSEKPLQNLTLSGAVSLPAGWKRAIISNGAMEIANEYGVSVGQELAMAAKESKAAIQRQVSKNRSLDWKSSNQSRDIYTGYFS